MSEATAGREIDGKRVKNAFPLAGMRKAIADHMMRSLQESAQLTIGGMIDMTEIIKLRKAMVAKEDVLGVRISYTDLMVMVVAQALKEHPIVNSSIIGNEVIQWEDVNMGVAVSYEIRDTTALVVPVIRNADRKSVVEIRQTLNELVERARNRRLRSEDVAGGTFTLSNVGTYETAGETFSTPILNQPQSAILVTRAFRDMPVVKDGQVVIRPMMPYSFTVDHRIIDGLASGLFRGTLNKLIQDPYQLSEFFGVSRETLGI
jgi:pyruvate dehydrogenase E2 component (dihydrolipoamide acetyltransferase)